MHQLKHRFLKADTKNTLTVYFNKFIHIYAAITLTIFKIHESRMRIYIYFYLAIKNVKLAGACLCDNLSFFYIVFFGRSKIYYKHHVYIRFAGTHDPDSWRFDS